MDDNHCEVNYCSLSTTMRYEPGSVIVVSTTFMYQLILSFIEIHSLTTL